MLDVMETSWKGHTIKVHPVAVRHLGGGAEVIARKLHRHCTDPARWADYIRLAPSSF